MIVVDSSAIIAFAFGEPEAEAFFGILTSAEKCLCSPVTFTECAMVLIGQRATTPLIEVQNLFWMLTIEVAEAEPAQGLLAADAFMRFGKGRHPDRLNLGDCFSYALAKSLNAPLLYKGDDFGQTDIVSAVATDARP